MKRFIFLFIAVMFLAGMALAQNPANFHLIYGNRDGSPMNVMLDADIKIPVWGATDTTYGNPDTVVFMHLPLLSNDSIIMSRLGGEFSDTLVGLWDEVSFLVPRDHSDNPEIPVGYTNQSMLAFARVEDPDDPQNWLYTLGDTVPICTFSMRTTSDQRLDGQTVCPFGRGTDLVNGGLIWGLVGIERWVIPTQTYGCLHFISSQSASDEALPSDFSLGQNYPNPFNPETNIEFSIPKEADISLCIYNILGQKVRTFLNGKYQAGQYIAHWNGRDESGAEAPSGAYFYRLVANHFVKTNKMLLVR